MKKRLFALSCAICLAGVIGLQAKTIYVKQGQSGFGTSWENAFSSLHAAIEIAVPGDVIFVAKGSYRPTEIAGDTPSYDVFDKAFVLKKDVKIYGGFAGVSETETIFGRNLAANTTTLNGNIDVPYHVVISAGDVGTACLDGFNITGGGLVKGTGSIIVNGAEVFRNSGGAIYNTGSSPTLSNITISNNTATSNGAGIYNNASSPTLTNITIDNCVATNGGGAICNINSSPILTNMIIRLNVAKFGGGIYNDNSSPLLTNVTIVGNVGKTNGGGIYNTGSSNPQLYNTIVATNVNEVVGDGTTYFHSLVAGLNLSGTNGNINAESITTKSHLFEANGHTLKPDCVAFGAGDLKYWTETGYAVGNEQTLLAKLGYSSMDEIKDLAGNPLVTNNKINIGAYGWFLPVISTELPAKSMPIAVYPTPSAPGEAVTVTADVDESLLAGAVIKAFDSTGRLLSVTPATGETTVISLPEESGIYLLRFEAKNGLVKDLKAMVK